jgi:hypothetical protein
VQFGEAIVGDLQLDPTGGIGLDDIHEIPRNTTERNFAEQGMQGGLGCDTSQQSPDSAPGSHVDRVHAQHGMHAGTCVIFVFVSLGIDLQIDVVDAHYFSSVDVDDLLVEQVAFQQEQTFVAVGCRPVCGPSRCPNAAIDR